ncbi:siderophore-interacting protein [Oceanicoccus sp. KOV_DT_Chl]|uniref:siderophore-interacting protein n=1 Tax=Oceanicoccus sp. KOV_DT_Chl TaxID=1904639 RepID=UPI000C7B8842|nr:siderophore-interacting protein [Oceanicoccus sp. KOV_DT_Chl]
MFFIKSKNVTVVWNQKLTTNMNRITFGGKDLKGVSANDEGAYIKLFFEQTGDNKPIKRSYTVRRAYPERCEIDVDFVCHGDEGPASKWALSANIGDQLKIKGPATRKMVNPIADWYFLVGDMTSLPALSVNLENMKDTARGYAIVEIKNENDKQRIDKPKGVELHWIINSDHHKSANLALDAVKKCPWLPGNLNVWVAAEFETTRTLKDYFKNEKNVLKRDIYASSYWKYKENTVAV